MLTCLPLKTTPEVRDMGVRDFSRVTIIGISWSQYQMSSQAKSPESCFVGVHEINLVGHGVSQPPCLFCAQNCTTSSACCITNVPFIGIGLNALEVDCFGLEGRTFPQTSVCPAIDHEEPGSVGRNLFFVSPSLPSSSEISWMSSFLIPTVDKQAVIVSCSCIRNFSSSLSWVGSVVSSTSAASSIGEASDLVLSCEIVFLAKATSCKAFASASCNLAMLAR